MTYHELYKKYGKGQKSKRRYKSFLQQTRRWFEKEKTRRGDQKRLSAVLQKIDEVINSEDFEDSFDWDSQPFLD